MNNTLHFSQSSTPHRGAFTLIELLTVMGIIVLLIGMLFPALQYSRRIAKGHVARQDMSNLKTALLAYRQEYGYFPQTASWDEMSAMLNGVIKPYDGSAASAWSSNNNPKRIRFMEFKTNQVNSAGEFLDPWQKPYIVLTDHGGAALQKSAWTDPTAEDGKIRTPDNSTVLQTTVAIYSSGSNGTDDDGDNTNFDDLTTWKE